MFNGWRNGINKKLMYKILVGALALCWAIWLRRNDMVFNNVTLELLLLCRLSSERLIGSFLGVVAEGE
jgi:hypothetical protein